MRRVNQIQDRLAELKKMLSLATEVSLCFGIRLQSLNGCWNKMWCPYCIKVELEDYSELEGGWCPVCEQWFPADICRDALDEEFCDEDYEEYD
jgi:hypothetical protein